MANLPCPCGTSSDAYSIQDNGWGHCFSCDKNFPPDYNDNPEKGRYDIDVSEQKAGVKERTFTELTTVFRDWPERGLPRDAVAKYKIDLCMNPDIDIASRSPIFRNGKHVGNKVRKRSVKGFYFEAGNKEDINQSELFGQFAFEPGSAQQITLVEGYEDAAAAWVLLGKRYPVVSVHGASSAIKDVQRNYEYLNSFDNIVIAFDSDEAKVGPDGSMRYPGQEAAKKVADLFKPGKCRILTLREHKDANDYLRAGAAKEFVAEWWKAPAYTPEGLKLGKEMWDEIINRPKHFTVSYPMEGLNKLTYGVRLSEFVTVTAETGLGKTSVLKEIAYSVLMNEEVKKENYGVGFMLLEEPNHDTALGLLSIHDDKPYHLPDTERDLDELRRAFDDVLNTDRVVIWDHFGSNSVEAVLDKVRHMHALGCKYIFLDHLSIIVSDQSGDERKQLDEISTKLKTLCMELNIALICIIHQNRQGQIRGTAGVEQLSNIVIKLYRDNTDNDPWRRNVTKLVVEKNRFCGRTGPAAWLFYDEITGRLRELDEREIARYEEGGALRDDERAF